MIGLLKLVIKQGKGEVTAWQHIYKAVHSQKAHATRQLAAIAFVTSEYCTFEWYRQRCECLRVGAT